MDNIFYSKSTKGFYDNRIHSESQIPTDARHITTERYRALLDAQDAGKTIVADDLGMPVVIDTVVAPPTIQEQISAFERQITPRRLREAVLGTDDGWLKKLDAKISMLRSQLKSD